MRPARTFRFVPFGPSVSVCVCFPGSPLSTARGLNNSSDIIAADLCVY